MLFPLVATAILSYLTYKLFARPPNFPSGPWNLPIVGYLPFLGRRPYLTFRDLSEKYGDIFSINMGYYRAIVLNSYELIRDALKEDNFTGRPPFPFFKFRSDDKGIIFSEGHTWQEMRRFALRNLRDFGLGKSSLERVIQEEVRELVDSHKRNVGKPITMHNTLNLSVLNALWTIITGERFDLDDPKAKAVIEKLSRSITEGISLRSSQLVPILNMVQSYPKNSVEFIHESKTMFLEIINEHKRVHKEGDASDFMHVFLDRMQEDEAQGRKTPFTGDEGLANLVITTMDLFVAGSETTSTTLLWVFLLLATHPEVQDKVQQELDAVVGKERMPSFDDRHSLPYTEAVLLESQRFASLVPLGLSHYATADTEFKGYLIPKGTMIIPNLYKVMHNPQTWAKPDEFYPEHFLTEDGKVKYVEQLIPFATGKRVCLGEGLAKIELFLFATALLQQYKFAFPAGQPKPSLIPPTSVILSPARYEVVLTLRS